MLSAKRKSDGQTAYAYFESGANGLFICPACDTEVVLETDAKRDNYFTHAIPFGCQYGEGESAEHRYCKREIYRALSKEPGVSSVLLEHSFGTVRPDVTFCINGVLVGIEVQISSLSIQTIQRRTIDYHRKGIYVLWILPWRPELNDERYAPTIWEKWLSALYFGRVYYWLEDLTVISYRFRSSVTSVPKKTWYSKDGKKMTGGGYSQRSRRFRTPVRCGTFNLVRDFAPKERFWWNGNSVTVPDAKLFMDISAISNMQ
jgi:competence protein CoiA